MYENGSLEIIIKQKKNNHFNPFLQKKYEKLR